MRLLGGIGIMLNTCWRTSIKGTIDDALVYRQDPNVTRATFGYRGYADSGYAPDYGTEYQNYKSTTGLIFPINDAAFSWRSRKQTLLADSTCAAELTV